jgi:hypothetical protein
MLTPQASFDLGRKVFGQPEVIEDLLEGFGDVLRLVAVSCEALVRLQATALSGFDLLFGISFV